MFQKVQDLFGWMRPGKCLMFVPSFVDSLIRTGEVLGE